MLIITVITSVIIRHKKGGQKAPKKTHRETRPQSRYYAPLPLAPTNSG